MTRMRCLALALVLAAFAVGCGGERTAVSPKTGWVLQGRLCSRIEDIAIDDELRQDLLLVFDCRHGN